MNNIDAIIEELTENFTYACDACLFLQLNDCNSTLYLMAGVGITGRDLEIIIEKCCPVFDEEHLYHTFRFLRSGFLGKDEIIANIQSSNPVPFITRPLIAGENWEHAYEIFSGDFRERFSKSNPKAR